jgi:hypothetical protein
MQRERLFFCGVDSDQYYVIITKVTKDIKKPFYLVENSDCTEEKYSSLEEAYLELFNILNNMVDDYFYKHTDDVSASNFFYRCFTTEQTIDAELLTLAKAHNIKFVQSNKIKLYTFGELDKTNYIYIVTKKIYSKYNKTFELVEIPK